MIHVCYACGSLLVLNLVQYAHTNINVNKNIRVPKKKAAPEILQRMDVWMKG